MDGYVGHMTQHAKNGKNRLRRAGPANGVKCVGQMRLFFIFYLFFNMISCPPLETTILHGSTPFLRQMTCFGGD